ncbi:hypothetical protein LTR15_005360 [Elasticomyces elasticus]|nr:hypothetical protein LTR15_005360 [Elasticomyces elasticus]
MLNGKFGEAAASVLTLPDDDPDSLEVLLHFMYHFEYLDRVDYDDEEYFLPEPLVAVRVYVIADKYDVPGLRGLAATHLEKDFRIEDNCWDEMSAAVRAISENTAQSDPTLWNVVLVKMRAHIDWLVPCSEFHKMLQDTPELSIKLLQGAKWL